MTETDIYTETIEIEIAIDMERDRDRETETRQRTCGRDGGTQLLFVFQS